MQLHCASLPNLSSAGPVPLLLPSARFAVLLSSLDSGSSACLQLSSLPLPLPLPHPHALFLGRGSGGCSSSVLAALDLWRARLLRCAGWTVAVWPAEQLLAAAAAVPAASWRALLQQQQPEQQQQQQQELQKGQCARL